MSFRSRVKAVALYLLDQWVLFGYGLACLLAYYFPHVAAHGGTIRSEYSILYGAVALIFLISGLQLSLGELRANLTNWRLHAITQGFSFFVVPAIFLAIVHIALAAGALRHGTIHTSVLVGMVVVSCIPTTIASNVVMTRNSGGDVPAAIMEVLLGNVVGAFLSPVLVYAFLPRTAEFDPWRPASPSTLGKMYANVAKQLGLSVLLPLAVGLTVRHLAPKKTPNVMARLYVSKYPSICLVLLIWATFSGAFETGSLQRMPTGSLLFDIFMNLALYLLFTFLCLVLARPPACVVRAWAWTVERTLWFLPGRARQTIRQLVKPMSREEATAVCFCGASKTTSLGIPLVAAMWVNADTMTVSMVQIPVLLYTLEMMFVAQLLVSFFKRYIRRGLRDGDGDEESRCGHGDSENEENQGGGG